ncbi:unnamed protein product [Pedinophyceae sp. YPF-701]|nr:unnamed protein product [Pedinophyceae sp. YPF-701]
MPIIQRLRAAFRRKKEEPSARQDTLQNDAFNPILGTDLCPPKLALDPSITSQEVRPVGSPAHARPGAPGGAHSSRPSSAATDFRSPPSQRQALADCRWFITSRDCPPDMARDVFSVHQFVPIREIGSGAKSRVWLAEDTISGRVVAFKVYDLCAMHQAEIDQLPHEARIHALLPAHPHVLPLHAAFCDWQACYFIMEPARGDLTSMFLDPREVGETQFVRRVVLPLLAALDHLHCHAVMHRDVKPENLVFGQDGMLMLSDFGFAVNVRSRRPTTRLGTLEFTAPEVLSSGQQDDGSQAPKALRNPYTFAADVWSVGCLVYEAFAMRTPFARGTHGDTARAIDDAAYVPAKWSSAAAQDFVRQCLKRDPTERASVSALLEHEWVLTATGMLPESAHAARRRVDSISPVPGSCRSSQRASALPAGEPTSCDATADQRTTAESTKSDDDAANDKARESTGTTEHGRAHAPDKRHDGRRSFDAPLRVPAGLAKGQEPKRSATSYCIGAASTACPPANGPSAFIGARKGPSAEGFPPQRKTRLNSTPAVMRGALGPRYGRFRVVSGVPELDPVARKQAAIQALRE